MKTFKSTFLKKLLFLFLGFSTVNINYGQFTSFRADDDAGSPDCATLTSGVEVFGGFGVTDIATCVSGGIPITDWSLKPYPAGWFGDVEGLLYYYDGSVWNATGNTSCGASSSFTWLGALGGGDDQTWSDPNNWDAVAVPTISDNCIIPAGAPVNIMFGGYCNNLTVDASAEFIIGDPSVTISVAGNYLDESGLTIVLGKLDIAGTFDCTRGITSIAGGGEIEVDQTSTVATTLGNTLNIAGGTFDANGTFNASGTTIAMDANSNLELGGSVISLGLLDDAEGTVTYDGNVQTVISDTYYNLTLAGSSPIYYKTPSGDITISNDLVISSATSHFQCLTNNIIVSGTTDNNGYISVSTGTLDFNGDYDATGGNTAFGDAGRMEFSGTVTSLGTFTRSTGTVEYDGGSQTVLGMSATSGSSYYNLEIDGSGIKSMAGTSKVYGDLILTASDFDINPNTTTRTVYLKNDMIRTSGNLISTNSGFINIDNAGAHDICSFTDIDITLKTTGGSGDVTTTGDITCKSIDLYSGSKTFLIAGQTINVDEDIVVTAGTLQITSGALNINSNSGSSALIDGGTLDIDGGTVTVGDNQLADLEITNGTLDVSGGTLNIVDQLSAPSGSPFITQTGGTINIKSYVGTSGGSTTENKFDMDAGVLNLTGGTLNLQGQVASASYYALSIASGVTVTSSSSHTTNIQSNNTTSNDEDMYLDLNGHDLGALRINLTDHDVYLVSPMGVSGQLTFNDGCINSDATNKLTISSSGSVSGASASSHVVGPMDIGTASTSDYIVPVGDGTRYRPVIISPDAGTATTYTTEFKNSAHSSTACGADVDHVAPGSWWDIDRSVGGADCYIGLNWDATSGVDTPLEMIICHYNSTTSEWEKKGGETELTGSDGTGSATAADGRVKSSSAFADFSPFNLGSGGSGNSLPIDLLSFSAECSHDVVDVNFTVVSQVNNDYFLIERSEDAMNWEELRILDGEGTSNIQMDYSLVDSDPISGLSYYRLSQVDHNGLSKTFSPISVQCGVNSSTGLVVGVYPNPVDNEFTFELDLEEFQGNNVYYTIVDIRGTIVASEKINLDRGYNKQTIDVNGLSNGVYILRFNNTRNYISETRIVKK